MRFGFPCPFTASRDSSTSRDLLEFTSFAIRHDVSAAVGSCALSNPPYVFQTLLGRCVLRREMPALETRSGPRHAWIELWCGDGAGADTAGECLFVTEIGVSIVSKQGESVEGSKPYERWCICERAPLLFFLQCW